MTNKLADHLAYPPRALRAERAAAYLSMSTAMFLTRLAMQGELADQGAAIMDRVFAEQQTWRKATARARIKLVEK